MYDFIIIFGVDIERAIGEIAKRSGFDLDDEQFQYYLAKSNEITKSNSNTEIDLNNPDMIDSAIKMISIFHSIHEENKNKESVNNKSRLLKNNQK